MNTCTVECIFPKGTTITAQDNVLILRGKKGDEKIIPITALQSIRMTPPTAMKYGNIYLDILKAPTGSVGFAGVAVNVGNEPIRCIYKKEQSAAAEKLYNYVLGLLSAPVEKVQNPAAFVDELVKLKNLLDQGALSPEEFEIAKKKLLGI